MSGPNNHPEQDVWIWPDMPLDLSSFQHGFGIMEGTEDMHLKEKILATAERAFCASSITRALWEMSSAEQIKIRSIFLTYIGDNFYKFDYEDPFVEIQNIGLVFCQLYHNHEGVCQQVLGNF